MSASQAPDTRVDLAGIPLRNPVLTASGTFGYGSEFAPFLDLRRIGGFVAKSLTLKPRFGNPPPRISEAPSGMLNAISLENVGVDAFIDEKLPMIPDGASAMRGGGFPKRGSSVRLLATKPPILRRSRNGANSVP